MAKMWNIVDNEIKCVYDRKIYNFIFEDNIKFYWQVVKQEKMNNVLLIPQLCQSFYKRCDINFKHSSKKILSYT